MGNLSTEHVRRVVADGLRSYGVGGVEVTVGPYEPDVPGRYVVVTRTGGPGLSTEGTIDVVGFQVRVGGDQDRAQDAEDLAMLVDRVLCTYPYPQEVSYASSLTGKLVSCKVTAVARSGGSPSALPLDDGDRSVYTCTYLVTSPTGY